MSKKRKKGAHGEHENTERWLVSYADFITVLLIFFIVMYSMSKVDANKYAAIASSLNFVFTGQRSIFEYPEIIEPPERKLTDAEQRALDEMRDEQRQFEEMLQAVKDFINNEDSSISQQPVGTNPVARLGDQIYTYEQERGLVISLKDTLLFESGSATLTPRAREVIRQVGGILKSVPNYIRVEGHTDNLPINNARFPSNWELSVLRATNVVHVLNEQAGVPPSRLSIIGYGEHRPLVANEDNLTRAMNRRVDIVILKQKFDYFESPVAFKDEY